MYHICYFLAGVWRITTVTGAEGSSRPLKNLMMVFCGDRAETGPLHLQARTDQAFSPNSTDEFEVRLVKNAKNIFICFI